MLSRVYVHKRRLRRGEPAIAVRTYRGVTYHREVIGNGYRIVQQPCPRCPVVKVYLETDHLIQPRR
jgi:hypothetical protein